MSLVHKTIWTIESRVNASFEMKDAYGGLLKGRLDFPYGTSKAQGFYVRHTGPNHGTAYTSLDSLITGIGGSSVTPQDCEYTIEFDTTKNSLGGGIYQVMASFPHEIHPHDVVTQADAARYMRSYGVDVYKWSGSQSLSATEGANSLNLPELDFSLELNSGDSDLDATQDVIKLVPSRSANRGVLVSSLITGTFINKLPHEVCLQIKSYDGSRVLQSAPVAVTSNTMTAVNANAMLYTNGLHHEFSDKGFQLSLVNLSAEALTISAVELRIHTFNNPDFSQ